MVKATTNFPNFLKKSSFFLSIKFNTKSLKILQNLPGLNAIKWISGKIKMLRIEHSAIEIDLSFVPVPKEYLMEKELQLEDDQLIRQITYESGIFSLASEHSIILSNVN